jgi:hypothetical protein
MVKALTGEVAYIHIKKTAEVIKKPEFQRFRFFYDQSIEKPMKQIKNPKIKPAYISIGL